MSLSSMTIRAACIEDAEEILAIYAPYILETAITFEYDVPSIEEFRQRIADTLEKYPYIVAEDETGKNSDMPEASPYTKLSNKFICCLSHLPCYFTLSYHNCA